MAVITKITAPRQLTGRRAIALELPEFLIRALEVRAEDANVGGPDAEHVTVEDLVELTIAESLSGQTSHFWKAEFRGSEALYHSGFET